MGNLNFFAQLNYNFNIIWVVCIKWNNHSFLGYCRSDKARSHRGDESGDDEQTADSFYPPPSRAHGSKKCKQCERQMEVRMMGLANLSLSLSAISLCTLILLLRPLIDS